MRHPSLTAGHTDGVFASDFVPLWCGAAAPGSPEAAAALQGLTSSGIVVNGLVSASLRETGQQWDFPNNWPPLQHAVAKGAQECCGDAGAALAKDMAQKWRAAPALRACIRTSIATHA